MKNSISIFPLADIHEFPPLLTTSTQLSLRNCHNGVYHPIPSPKLLSAPRVESGISATSTTWSHVFARYSPPALEQTTSIDFSLQRPSFLTNEHESLTRFSTTMLTCGFCAAGGMSIVNGSRVGALKVDSQRSLSTMIESIGRASGIV